MKKRNFIIFVFLVSAFCLRVSAAIGDVFLPIADISQLDAGDDIIIISQEYGVGMSVFQDNGKIKSCGIQRDKQFNTVTAVNDSLCVCTIQRQGSGWSLKTADGEWLVVRDTRSSEYLDITGDLKNRLNVVNMTFTSAGDCLLAFGKHYLKYNGEGKFGSYPNKDSVLPVQICRKLKSSVVFESVELSERGENSSILNNACDARVRALTVGRTFCRDGGFYTLCLPVALNEADILNSFGGATFYEFASVAVTDDNGIVFHFVRVVGTKAGVPYLMRLDDNSGDDVVSPLLHNKILLAQMPVSVNHIVGGRLYSFVGSFNPVSLEENGSFRFLSNDGLQLVTPNGNGQLGGMRGYFKLPAVMPSVSFDTEKAVANCAIELDELLENKLDSGTTGVESVGLSEKAVMQEDIYNLLGQRQLGGFEGLPKGIYIVGGRKVVKQ